MKVKIGVVSELLISVGMGWAPFVEGLLDSSLSFSAVMTSDSSCLMALDLQLSPSQLRSSLKEGNEYSPCHFHDHHHAYQNDNQAVHNHRHNDLRPAEVLMKAFILFSFLSTIIIIIIIIIIIHHHHDHHHNHHSL